ncbi:MAG: cell wall-binding repeat-containing protein [Acidimicrobiia bacterium]
MAEEFFPGENEPRVVGFASGRAFPDGLSGGAHVASADQPGPLLLTEPGSVPSTVLEYLRERRGQIVDGFLYGGTTAVQEAVRLALQDAIS